MTIDDAVQETTIEFSRSKKLVTINSDGEVVIGEMTMQDAVWVIRKMGKALHECRTASLDT